MRIRLTIGISCALCLLLICTVQAQWVQSNGPEKFPKSGFTPHLPGQPLADHATSYRIAGKKASQYTAEDWGIVIDSTWGAGQTASEQLNIFDAFWDTVDQRWGGFPNLTLNWDSLRTVYRSQIGSGLSRGRFYALMSRMWLPLTELHTIIHDHKVDMTFGVSSWQYRRGVPLLCIGSSFGSLIGAAVTPLPDSTNLVYRVGPENPLGLEPGDLILGYERVPWNRLYQQLIDAGLPVSVYYSWPGATRESAEYSSLMSVACNWGLFDTIDVVKYSSGDTLHLSTAPLEALTKKVWLNDQVPIAGVPMPQGAANGTVAVSWGVVEGTNVGYIYVWDWYTPSTPQLFSNAISDLRQNKNVDGLVIDFRMNWGEDYSYANAGFSQLFNFDPSSNMSIAIRDSRTNRMSFSLRGATWGFTPGAFLFDHPIAVLIGPGCLSSGDGNAFRMRFHPMAHSFGKPTNGAFVTQTGLEAFFSDAWHYIVPTGTIYSNVPEEGYFIHKGVQPDEEVWLTRDGVAKGEDDVVKRAIEWITTLTFAHDVAIDRTYAMPHQDSVSVTAILANPLNHSAVLSAIVTDTSGVVRDSVLLSNDGMHGDGLAGDSIWGCQIPAPSDEGIFKISLRTDDITKSSFRKLPNIVGFATAGPLTLDSVGVSKYMGIYYRLTPYIRNNGSSFTVRGAKVTLRCNDPWVTQITSGVGLPDLSPGTTKGSTSPVYVAYDTAAHPTYFNLYADISVNGVIYWTDSTRRTVTGIGKAEALPVRYALEQNYPNPFNPSTEIRYSIPHTVHVSLKVYDVLGQEVRELVDRFEQAGEKTVRFNAEGLPSGVYFYRLQAGSFTETKKLILIR